MMFYSDQFMEQIAKLRQERTRLVQQHNAWPIKDLAALKKKYNPFLKAMPSRANTMAINKLIKEEQEMHEVMNDLLQNRKARLSRIMEVNKLIDDLEKEIRSMNH